MSGLKAKLEAAQSAAAPSADPKPPLEAPPAQPPEPVQMQSIDQVVAATVAAVTAAQQKVEKNTAKPLGKVKVDEASRALAQAQVDAAGTQWYYLSKPRYIRDVRWEDCRLVQASPKAPAKVQLNRKVVRVDRATGLCTVADRAEADDLTEQPTTPPVDNRPGVRTFGVPTAAQHHDGITDASDITAGTAAIVPPAGNPVIIPR